MDYKSPKLKDGQHLRGYSQVTIDTVMNDFNSGQLKVRMKKMAAQVNFYLFLNAFRSFELLDAWKCALQGPSYLLSIYFYLVFVIFYLLTSNQILSIRLNLNFIFIKSIYIIIDLFLSWHRRYTTPR